MAKTKHQRLPEAAPPVSTGEESTELITELAFGSDGLLYVNAEHLTAEEREGRRLFQGYAMTPEEAQRAGSAMHKIAFNVTVVAMAKPRGAPP